MNELANIILPLILVGLIGLGTGVAIGLALVSLRGTKGPAGKPPSRYAVEVLRVYRDKRNQALSVEVAGQVFKAADQLADKWRTAILRIVDDLQLWLGVSDIGQRISPPKPATPASKEAIPFSLQPITPTPVVAADPAVSAAAASTVKPPSLDTAEIIARAIAPDTPKDTGEVRSIAAQVDEILQEKLAKSALRNRVVQISDHPGGGIVVQVDDQEYEGVSDVPDPAVQKLLRDSVAEWERRVSGG
jgi:hypothetical protein